MRVCHEVTGIDPAVKRVTVRNLNTGEESEEATTSCCSPRELSPPGPGWRGGPGAVFTLRTVEDTLRIRKFVTEHHPKTALLAGGGFIGLEMAENLTELGVQVTIVQRPRQVLAPWTGTWPSWSMGCCVPTGSG